MRLIINPWTRRDLIVLVAVLLLATLLRVAQLDLTDYRFDQASLVGLAQDLITGKHFPTEGILPSVGFPAPPTMDFLVAIPYLFSSNPLFAEYCVVLLNVFGVALLYRIAQRYFSSTIALVASLTYACSPWAIEFSRQIWPPHLVTPFVLASIFCGLLGFVEGRRWAQVLSLPLMSIGIALHYAVIALLTIFVWFLWRKRASGWAVALSIAITLIILIPFFAGFTGSSIETIKTTMAQHRESGSTDTFALAVSTRLVSGAGVERKFGLPDTDYTLQVPLVFWITAAIPVIIGLVVIRSHRLAPLLYLWAFSALVILTILPINTYDHYLISSLPALCLLAGIGLQTLVARLHPALFVPWIAILAIECFLWFNLLSTVRTTATGDFGPTLADLLLIRQKLSESQDVIIVGGITGSSGADVWSTLLFGDTACVRELVIAGGGIAVFPAHSFVLLSAPGIESLPTPYLPNASQRFPLRPGEGTYTLDSFDQAPTWSGASLTAIEPAQFDNGIRLQGYTFADHRLYLEWTLPGQSPQDYQYFVHLLDARGDRIAQHDTSFYSGKYRCANDRIITWIDLERPVDTATLRIGMYRLDQGKILGNNIINSSGDSASPWIDIALPNGD